MSTTRRSPVSPTAGRGVYLLSDLAADVASYASGLESDPARLAAVSERRAALTALTRKYGEDIDEVLAWSQASAQRLFELDDTDDRIARLRAERDDLRATLSGLAATISAARHDAAQRLGDQVTAELALLAMPHARVAVSVTRHDDPDGLEVDGRAVRFGPDGVDDVELLLAANVGADARPLAKGASGGELSRVMLALEVVLAGTSPVPTFVFDEVDAGVGGKAAVEVGRRLAMLARTSQVVVVTHLPQVAAYADWHVVVHEVQRRAGHHVRSAGARRRGPGAGAVPDARRHGGVGDRAGARRGAPRHRP